MPIDLQLHRVQKLLKLLGNPHHHPKFIHIAGTNGKGSVCAYISHALTASGIHNGRFNSPHLVTPRDSIQCDNHPVSEYIYNTSKAHVQKTNDEFNIGCTDFELLTCTAFEIFSRLTVPIAILEVGVGGRMDATNVIPAESTLAVGITKIGLDHQGLLGNTIAEIAYQKVGIFKENVPAIIDGTNSEIVLEVARKEALKLNSQLIIANRADNDENLEPGLLGDYQLDNVSVAVQILKNIKDSRITDESIKKGIKDTKWPGRLQLYNFLLKKLDKYENSDDEVIKMVLDGAHNTQAAIELGKCLNDMRNDFKSFVFVIGITKGKDVSELFKKLITPNDTVIFTQFNENIEGMPWIEPTDAQELSNELKAQKVDCQNNIAISNVNDALIKATEISDKTGGRIVVCGSLYLVADILRL